MDNNTIVSVSNLVKKFPVKSGFFTAVDSISFEIKKGEILGFLGPNGAGKTTTIQMLLGVMTPTAGSIKVFGRDLAWSRSEILKQVNFSSSYVNLPWRLSVYENLQVFAGLYEIADPEKRIDELLAVFEATDLKHKRFSHLSSGQRTRIMLCKAFLNRPSLLLLDEPTASLDPDLADKTRQFLLRLQKKEQLSILFTSHNMSEVEEVCDRVIFLNKGKIIAEDTPQGLARRSKKIKVRLFVADGLKRTIQHAQSLDLKYQTTERSIVIELEETDISPFLQGLARAGVDYSEITIDKPSLEDFFLEVTRQ